MIISTRRQGQPRILSLRNLTDRCQKFTILVTPSGQAGWRDSWPNFTLERSESGQERIAHWPGRNLLIKLSQMENSPDIYFSGDSALCGMWSDISGRQWRGHSDVLFWWYLIGADTRVRGGKVYRETRAAGVERVGGLAPVAWLPGVQLRLPVGGVVDPGLLVVGRGVEGGGVVASGGGGEPGSQGQILGWK